MNHLFKYRWNTPLIRWPLIYPLPGTGTPKYSQRWSLEFAQEWRPMSWIWPPGAKSWDPWNLGVLTRLDVWKCRTNPKLDLTFCLGSGRGLRLQYAFPTKNKQTKNHQDLEMMMKLKWSEVDLCSFKWQAQRRLPCQSFQAYNMYEWTLSELSHGIHVWYIYLHLPLNQPNVGKYTIHGWYGYHHHANLSGKIPSNAKTPAFMKGLDYGFHHTCPSRGQSLRVIWVKGINAVNFIGWGCPKYETLSAGVFLWKCFIFLGGIWVQLWLILIIYFFQVKVANK